MTIPGIAFGLLCSMLIGALFHVAVDGGPARLLLYLLLSAGGFALGHWLGDLENWSFWSIGGLRLGTAILGSLLTLGVGHWLTQARATGRGEGDGV